MNDTGYTPTPGSAAAKAVEYLASLGAGVEVPSPTLAREIKCRGSSLDPGLSSAKRHGVIVYRLHRSPRGRTVGMWSLPRAVAPADDGAPVQRRIPVGEATELNWKPSPLDAAWHPLAQKNDPPEKAPTEAAQVGGQELRDGHAEGRPDPVLTPEQYVAAIGTDTAPTRFALWSDGTLQIDRDTVGGAAALVLLSRDEVRQMVAYLDDPARGVRELAGAV